MAYKVPQPSARRARLAPLSGNSFVAIIPFPKYFGSCFLAAASVVPKPTTAAIPETPARKIPAAKLYCKVYKANIDCLPLTLNSLLYLDLCSTSGTLTFCSILQFFSVYIANIFK